MKFSPTRGNRGGMGENRVSTFEEGISEWNWSKKVMLFILKNWWIGYYSLFFRLMQGRSEFYKNSVGSALSFGSKMFTKRLPLLLLK